MKKGLVFVLVLGLVGFGIGVSKGLIYGVDYYVDSLNGNDTNSGTNWETAFKTIQKAADVTQAGEIVYVNEGVYSEVVTLKNNGTSDNPIVFKSVGKAILKSDFQGREAGFYMWLRRYIIIDGFTIIKGFGYYGYGIDARDNIGTIIRNCVMTQCGRAIEFLDRSYSNIVQNCVIYRNNIGVHIRSDSSYQLIQNNTIVFNNQGIYLEGFCSNNEIENNIIYSNQTGILADKPTAGISDYNDVYSNGVNYSGVDPGPHDMSVDPKFLEEANDIYYLKPTSSLINAGSVKDGYFQTIGALGIGKYSSYSADLWSGWIDENGAPISASTLVELDANGNIKLKDGITSAAVRSPVFDAGKSNTIIKSVDCKADEFLGLPSGSRQVIDYDNVTITREVRWRGSNTSFSATDLTPAWQETYKQEKMDKQYRYLQIEYVMRVNGK